MKRQEFVYNTRTGDNTRFVYIAKMEQKANFVYKELSEMPKPAKLKIRRNENYA